MMSDAKLYQGSWRCGQISFSAGDFSAKAANCHCTMCRKFHGAAFGTLVAVGKINWLSGESLLKTYKANNKTERLFCHECGSSLAFISASSQNKKTEIAIACFDEDIPVQVDANIHVKSKANWHHVHESIPSFLGDRT